MDFEQESFILHDGRWLPESEYRELTGWWKSCQKFFASSDLVRLLMVMLDEKSFCRMACVNRALNKTSKMGIVVNARWKWEDSFSRRLSIHESTSVEFGCKCVWLKNYPEKVQRVNCELFHNQRLKKKVMIIRKDEENAVKLKRFDTASHVLFIGIAAVGSDNWKFSVPKTSSVKLLCLHSGCSVTRYVIDRKNNTGHNFFYRLIVRSIKFFSLHTERIYTISGDSVENKTAFGATPAVCD